MPEHALEQDADLANGDRRRYLHLNRTKRTVGAIEFVYSNPPRGSFNRGLYYLSLFNWTAFLFQLLRNGAANVIL